MLDCSKLCVDKKTMPRLYKYIFYGLIFFHHSCSDVGKTKNNTFTIATYDDVKDWDPATAFSLETLPMANIYEPLLWYDANGDKPRFVSGLAKDYTKSKDGLVWTFKLRDSVYFHDGSKFNANSLRQIIERNRTLKRGASYIWSSIVSVIVENEHQITFKLKEPIPFDRVVSSQYGAWIYSPQLLNKDILKNKSGYASGTGPYILKEWVKNSHIILEKNKNYWRGWPQNNHFEIIHIKVVSEASTRIQMLKKGLADYAVLIPAHLLKSISLNTDIVIADYPSWVNHFYLLNTEKPPTNNLWVRRAIASSFDRGVLVDHVYLKTATEANGVLPHSLPLVSPPDSLISFSPQKAKEYFKRSGEKEGVEVDLSYVSTSEEYRLTSLMLLDNLRKTGMKLVIKPGLWTANWDKARNIKTAPNIISMAWWPTLSSPSDWFFGLYKSEENPLFNLSRFSSATVDSLIDQGWKNEATNPELSSRAYKKIQDILIDKCVVIPAVDINIRAVHRSDIVGLKSNPAYSTLSVYNLERKP